MGQRSSNKAVKRCVSGGTTTDCIEFVSTMDIPCLSICEGDSLTAVQEVIITKLCELVGETDMSTVVLPDCFIAAFGSEDKTILNFISFLLETACNQQGEIDALPTTNNPVVSLQYSCCADNPCITNTTVTLSEHIQNVLTCLCTLKDTVDTLESTVDDLNTQVDSLSTQLNSLNTTVNKIITGITNANAADSFPITIT